MVFECVWELGTRGFDSCLWLCRALSLPLFFHLQTGVMYLAMLQSWFLDSRKLMYIMRSDSGRAGELQL